MFRLGEQVFQPVQVDGLLPDFRQEPKPTPAHDPPVHSRGTGRCDHASERKYLGALRALDELVLRNESDVTIPLAQTCDPPESHRLTVCG